MTPASKIPVFLLALTVLGSISSASAQESRWGSSDDDVVKFIMAASAMWSDSNCSPQPGLDDVIADDFQGTFTNGQRFGKDKAIAADPALMQLSSHCQLDEVRVRFFGDSMAIAYGGEHRMRRDNEGKEAKRCQIWTDTWLKRNGRWQVVASHDTLVPCPQ